MSAPKKVALEINSMINKKLREFQKNSGGGTATSANQVSYNNSTTGMTATQVQAAIDELFTDVDNGKDLIAAAITDRGIIASGDETFEELSDKIMMLIKNIVRQYIDTFGLEAFYDSIETYDIDLYNVSSSNLDKYPYSDTFSLESEYSSSDSYDIVITPV